MNSTQNEEMDILGFDPSQLSINTPVESTQFTSNIYKTRPADSKSEDGIYRAQIKIIYNPFNFKQSVIEQQSYALQDADGFFSVISSLTVNDTSCPIFKAWKTCHYSKEDYLFNQQKPKNEGGRGLFDKRYGRYVTIQVIDDQNNPDLNGKYMFWKVPKAIWEIVNAKQSPTNPQKASIPVMDFLFGRAIDIEVKPGPGKPDEERYRRETKYFGEFSEDPVSCTNPDGSPLLNPEQQAVLDTYINDMRAVWKEKDPNIRNSTKAAIDASPNTQKLKEIYKEVIEKIKTFCPNVEDLTYKPWTPEVTKRVNNWISIVLAGNDPTIPNLATITDSISNDISNVNTADIPEVDTSNDDDDLPF